jgi:hypothetical protein
MARFVGLGDGAGGGGDGPVDDTGCHEGGMYSYDCVSCEDDGDDGVVVVDGEVV